MAYGGHQSLIPVLLPRAWVGGGGSAKDGAHGWETKPGVNKVRQDSLSGGACGTVGDHVWGPLEPDWRRQSAQR